MIQFPMREPLAVIKIYDESNIKLFKNKTIKFELSSSPKRKFIESFNERSAENENFVIVHEKISSKAFAKALKLSFYYRKFVPILF